MAPRRSCCATRPDGPHRATCHRWLRKILFAGREVSCCVHCGCEVTPETATLEHLVPLAKGGTYDLANLALACAPCNNGRRANPLNGYGTNKPPKARHYRDPRGREQRLIKLRKREESA